MHHNLGGLRESHPWSLPLRPVRQVYPLSPNINMHILLSVFHTFLTVLVERICTNIKAFHAW